MKVTPHTIFDNVLFLQFDYLVGPVEAYACSDNTLSSMFASGRGGNSTGALWNVARTERLPLTGKEIRRPTLPATSSRLGGRLDLLGLSGFLLKSGMLVS